MEMTTKDLIKICKDGGYYRTPELNEVLYFHYKGFEAITPAIQEYKNARCIWLEGNALSKIENLEGLDEVRQLYLQENLIRKVEGLAGLQKLVSLNLSNNFITHLEGLSALPNLKTLNLKKNRLKLTENIRHVVECRALETLDLTDNKLEEEDCVEEVFVKMPQLLTLYAHQNPFTAKVKPYRKTLVGRLENLRYLDDRPVFEDERRLTNAWIRGGNDAEKTEREKIRQEKEERDERNREAFRQLIAQAKQEKAEREARGEELQNTEFYQRNYTKRTPEDEWYTAERARNAAKSEEVRRMERQMLVDPLPLPDSDDGDASAVEAAAPAATPDEDDAAQPAGGEASSGDEGAAPYRKIDDELRYPEPVPPGTEDAWTAEAVVAAAEQKQEITYVDPTAEEPTDPNANHPARPMVWGTPAYKKLWEQAVAAGIEHEKAEAAAAMQKAARGSKAGMMALTDALSDADDADGAAQAHIDPTAAVVEEDLEMEELD